MNKSLTYVLRYPVFLEKKNNSMIEGICNDFAIEFPNFYLI